MRQCGRAMAEWAVLVPIVDIFRSPDSKLQFASFGDESLDVCLDHACTLYR